LEDKSNNRIGRRKASYQTLFQQSNKFGRESVALKLHLAIEQVRKGVSGELKPLEPERNPQVAGFLIGKQSAVKNWGLRISGGALRFGGFWFVFRSLAPFPTALSIAL